MKKRLLSALVIVPPMFVFIVYAPSVLGLGVLMLVSTLLLLEYCRLLDRARIPVFRAVAVVFGLCLMLVTYAGFRYGVPADQPGKALRAAEWEGLLLALAVPVLLVRQFPQKYNQQPLATMGCTLLGILYVPFLMNFFVKMGLTWDNPRIFDNLKGTTGCYLMCYVITVAKMTDAGAFFVGSAIGRHKLVPRLSPSKTWEGLAGAIVTGVATSCVMLWAYGWRFGALHAGPGHAVALGLLVSLAGMAGDLAESQLKRAAETKDTGTLVPGIGGLLDMIDSIIFVGPVTYVYARLLL